MLDCKTYGTYHFKKVSKSFSFVGEFQLEILIITHKHNRERQNQKNFKILGYVMLMLNFGLTFIRLYCS